MEEMEEVAFWNSVNITLGSTESSASRKMGDASQTRMIVAVGMGAIVSISLNLGLIIAKSLLSRRYVEENVGGTSGPNCGPLYLGRVKTALGRIHLTGFDVLILNHLFINILSTLFIDPWDIIAYSVLGSGWPFSESFCYFSRFCATFLPFMSSWNIVLMTLHQLLAFIFLKHYWFNWNFYYNDTVRSATRILPSVLIWIVGLGIHAPITYIAWGISHQPGYCGIENLFALLHDGLGMFVLPSIVSLLLIIMMFAVKGYTHHAFPQVDDASTDNTSPAAAVQFQSTSTDSVWHIGSDYRQEPFEHDTEATTTGINEDAFTSDDKDTLIISTPPPPYEMSSAQQTPTHPVTLREITLETVTIACALVVGLLIFIGPYGIFALVLDNGLRVQEDFRYLNHFWFFKICFPWALAKPLFEPIVILTVMGVCRADQLRTWWRRRHHQEAHASSHARERTWSEHAATAQGHTHGNGIHV